MYCVFKEPLVTQKSPVKNEEVDKKATKQCVLSYILSVLSMDLTNIMPSLSVWGWGTVSKRMGVEDLL